MYRSRRPLAVGRSHPDTAPPPEPERRVRTVPYSALRRVPPATAHPPGHPCPHTYANWRTGRKQTSSLPLNSAIDASKALRGGHIVQHRGPPTRGRRAHWGEIAMPDTTSALTPEAVALLRGGPRAAVTVAVLALRLRGSVLPGRPGTMRTSGAATGSEHPLEKAVHAALYRPTGLRNLVDRPRVREALTALRTDLVAAGLLRTVPAMKTRAGRRALRELRERLPLPEGLTRPSGVRQAGWTQADMVLAVALYGEPALVAVAPHFAREAGLLGRLAVDDGVSPPPWGGHGGSGFGDGCGSVYG
ncbi:TIGR04222 domain-containing membrane protein [Streptomyces sp. NPDC002004]